MTGDYEFDETNDRCLDAKLPEPPKKRSCRRLHYPTITGRHCEGQVCVFLYLIIERQLQGVGVRLVCAACVNKDEEAITSPDCEVPDGAPKGSTWHRALVMHVFRD